MGSGLQDAGQGEGNHEDWIKGEKTWERDKGEKWKNEDWTRGKKHVSYTRGWWTMESKKWGVSGQEEGKHEDWTRGYWTRVKKTGVLDKGKEKIEDWIREGKDDYRTRWRNYED
jgi:hypothetical protein